MLDTKKFINHLIIAAQIQGFKPRGLEYQELFDSFDFEAFEKHLKFIKTDEFGLVLYKLVLCDAFFMPSLIDFTIKNGNVFSDFIIAQCGGSDLLLREEFGEYENCDSVCAPPPKALEGNYYLVDDILYTHEPKMFLMDWILPHFQGSGCMRFYGSFLTSEDSAALKFVEAAASSRIIPAEGYNEMIENRENWVEEKLYGEYEGDN